MKHRDFPWFFGTVYQRVTVLTGEFLENTQAGYDMTFTGLAMGFRWP